MKAKSILPLFLLVLTACGNGNPWTSLKFDGMKGNVSKVKTLRYGAHEKFGEIMEDYNDLVAVFVREFDEKGHLTKYVEYTEYGAPLIKKEFEYDENGQAVLQTLSFREDNLVETGRVVDRSKDYVKWEWSDGNEYKSIEECFYDGLSCKHFSDNELSLEERIDKKGRLVESQSYYRGGEPTYHCTTWFDDEKNVVSKEKTENYYDGYTVTTTYKYPDYDAKGNWVTRHVWEDGEIKYVEKREIYYR